MISSFFLSFKTFAANSIALAPLVTAKALPFDFKYFKNLFSNFF